MYFDIEKGGMIEAPVLWVYFAITNIDIVANINKDQLQIKRKSDRTYCGRIFGIDLELDILGDKQPNIEGEVNIDVDVEMPWSMGSSHTRADYRYHAIDDESTMVDLKFEFRTTGIAMALYFVLIKKRIQKYLKKILVNLQNGATLIASHDKSLEKVLSSEQVNRISQFRLEYQAVKTGPTHQARGEEIISEKIQRAWDPELSDLVSLVGRLESKAETLERELILIKEARHAAFTLTSARRMLELIIMHLCEKYLERDRGSEPLARVIDKLDRVGGIPDSVCASMRNLNAIAKFGPHPKESLRPRQVREALSTLCSIMEWYVNDIAKNIINNVKAERDIVDRKIEKYRQLCMGALLDGIITDKEREILEKKRVEFGISKEDAEMIESECEVDE